MVGTTMHDEAIPPALSNRQRAYLRVPKNGCMDPKIDTLRRMQYIFLYVPPQSIRRLGSRAAPHRAALAVSWIPMKTNVYIDGFNLYYGCLKGTTHKWLDLALFCQASFPRPRNQINRIRYFTAHVNARPNDPQQPIRQQTYLRALRTIPNLTTHLGSYLEKITRLRLHPPPASGPRTVQVMQSEEKGSDVNIATYLLVDAFDDDYEVAVVVSTTPTRPSQSEWCGAGSRKRY